MKERTPRSLRDAFPEDYEPVLSTTKDRIFTALISVVIVVVIGLVVGFTIYLRN